MILRISMMYMHIQIKLSTSCMHQGVDLETCIHIDYDQ